MGVEDYRLLAIQNDLYKRLKARDEARERAVSNKLHELEQKHEFANAQFLKHFAQVSELVEPTAEDAQAKVKLADKMLLLPPLFNGEKPEKVKTHYKGLISLLNSKLRKVIQKIQQGKLLNYYT